MSHNEEAFLTNIHVKVAAHDIQLLTLAKRIGFIIQ